MTFNRQVGYSASGQRYLLSIDGDTPVPLESLSITDNSHLGSGLLQPPREILVEAITVPGSVYSAPRQWGKSTVGQVLGELDQLRAQVTRLESWLSGVQPVDDSDVPGRSYCGVCGHVLPGHASGCPAAPD